jgi:L-aminopeptidase/D-esterase-like protein
MQYLEERGVGFRAGPVHVPIVPGAVIFDLGVGDKSVRPNREMGYQACVNGSKDSVEMGQVGAGTGATVGKATGFIASAGGVGSASRGLSSGLIVGAIVVVNAVGNIVNPTTGEILAGAKDEETGTFVDVVQHLSDGPRSDAEHGWPFGTNTTIGVVATNASLSPSEATKVAQMAHDGLARAIRPAHTMFDGDTLFTLSIGSQNAPVNTVGIIAAEVVAEAIVRAVRR